MTQRAHHDEHKPARPSPAGLPLSYGLRITGPINEQSKGAGSASYGRCRSSRGVRTDRAAALACAARPGRADPEPRVLADRVPRNQQRRTKGNHSGVPSGNGPHPPCFRTSLKFSSIPIRHSKDFPGKCLTCITSAYLADAIRTGSDLGRLYTAMRMGAPIFGMHGSFIVVRNDAEQSMGFDVGPVGSLTEDAWWGTLAMDAGYRCRWVEGHLSEQCTHSIRDFMKQRRRWFNGMHRTSWPCTSPQRLSACAYIWTTITSGTGFSGCAGL